MTKSFIFYSDSQSGSQCGKQTPLKVSIVVECRDQDGCDATYDIEYIENMDTQAEVLADQLLLSEQRRLDRECQDYANELAPDAAREYIIGQADALYDAWKDRE